MRVQTKLMLKGKEGRQNGKDRSIQWTLGARKGRILGHSQGLGLAECEVEVLFIDRIPEGRQTLKWSLEDGTEVESRRNKTSIKFTVVKVTRNRKGRER